ncbi:GNAT family N-acetyltransferase [Hymenobacter arizonensis]|uniref:Protein N-acetyltransferase, RimJ/RimL family n=1 Tax=Hymenobacter arizonensis TaxID=1227077 RepID=A0A1I5UUA5_HYMAR|nr:GNAT family protein [Hymenobacter arizonensis]SFP98789.1 Protein N-acetyltransferase, RimJ/RimL family [Hymenobacter arizonensis]
MVLLKPLTENDFPQLISWVDNERLLKEWSDPMFTYPLTTEQLHQYLQHANQPRKSEVFAYKALDAATGDVVGQISLAHLNWNDSTGRISSVLVGDEALRCRGYGQAMVKALLKIGFEKLGLRRISLGVYDFNSPAIRCYQRCGFHHIGTLRHVVRYQDEYWSSVEMSIMQHEWRQTGAETQAA